MDVERQTLSGLKWSTTAKLFTQITSWCVTLVVIRLLVPADYGLMALSAVIMSVFAGIAELGLGASLIQARNPTREDLARVSGALFLLNGTCMLIICASAPLFAQIFGHPSLERIVQVSSLQLALGALGSVPESIAYREMRFRWLAAIDITSGLVTSGTTLALALLGVGVWALVIGNLAGLAMRTVVLLAGGTVVAPQLRLRGMGHFLRFGGAWSASRFAWQLTYQADVILAGRLLTQEAVGLYSVAAQLANLPLQKAMSVLNQVAFPAIARLQEELPRMRRRLLDAIRLVGFGAIPALWGISAVAPEFVAAVLGKHWNAAVLPLQTVALVAPLRIVAGLFSTAICALGRADLDLINNVITLVMFPIVLICGVHWGVSGLAISYALAVVASCVLNFPRMFRTVGIPARQVLGAFGMSLLAGVGMLVAVAVARYGLGDLPDATRLAVLIAVGGAAYLGLLSILDRAIWSDLRRLASALRGNGA
jgi:teichuronic acid exporter